MYAIPAIDLYEGCAVRLTQGDYLQRTVFSADPLGVARNFARAGAEWLHIVDLEGARSGRTDNLSMIEKIVAGCGLKVELGGGVRSMETVERYLSMGVRRVILGTAAITDPDFLLAAVQKYGERVAVGVDVRDGMVAIRGWTELSEKTCEDFLRQLERDGVSTVICTDISRDGLLSGTNRELYRRLCGAFSMRLIASGGVSTLEDVSALSGMGLYGAILGKALYTGRLDLAQAVLLGRREVP